LASVDICVINSDTAQGILYTLVSLRNNWENIHLIDLGSGTDTIANKQITAAYYAEFMTDQLLAVRRPRL
jgi:predicted RNA methylase